MQNHKKYMQLALELAWLNKGRTSPNPTVGAVLVKNNKIISCGVTQKPGSFHAERMALKDLSLKESEGSTLYVTLEPCCSYGRTPPCTQIIIEKKVKKVFVAVEDPHPNVCGKGIQTLKDAGIEVELGLLKKQASEINLDFFTSVVEKRPLVTLKYAMTLDGKMATLSGDSKWISNSRSRKITHILRYRSDAILVGIGTVLADNPTLNARLFNREKPLLRVIIDPNGESPLKSNICSDDLPTLFAVKKGKASKEWLNQIINTPNKEIWEDESSSKYIILRDLLSYLYEAKNILSLFVEGGAFVFGSFLREKLADRFFSFLGNRIIGEGLSPFSGIQLNSIKSGVLLDDIHSKQLENNIMIYGKFTWT